MNSVQHIVCFGGGHIAEALLMPYLKDKRYAITVVDPAESIRLSWSARGVQTLARLVYPLPADLVLIAVRPVHVKDLSVACAQYAHNTVVSVVAGVSCAELSSLLGLSSCIRAMPNLAAAVGQGVIGLYAPPSCTLEIHQQVTLFFEGLGLAVWLTEETTLDVIAAVAGSGPAYLFAILDHWYQAACALGLASEEARRIVLHTASGALSLIQAHPERSFDEWCTAVASRGGMTERALSILKTPEMAASWCEAIQSAHRHARAMAEALLSSPLDHTRE